MTRTRNKRQHNDHQTRQTLIRRALLGLDYWLYGKAFLLPFCDYLKIFLNKPDPTIITLWNSADTQRPIFSTHPNIETNFCEEGGVVIPHSKQVVACYRLTGASFLCDEKARLDFDQLFAHPDFCSTPEGEVFARSLKRATDPVGAPRNGTACKTAHEKAGEQTDWDVICEAVFSNVWKVLEDSPHFCLRGHGNLRTTNLFPFMFVAKDSKDTRASEITHQLQCVFSDTHRSFLRSNEAQAKDLKEQFGRVFGREAAMAFQTGTITLADHLKGRDLSAANGCPGFKMLAQMHRVYVPIHIEGASWIVLLRFYKDSDISGCYDVFHFYHDVIPRIGAMLRTESKSVYLGHIENVFAQEIANPDYPSFVNRFNRQCAALVQRYPFPEVRLDESVGDDPSRLILPDGCGVGVTIRKTSWFDPQVDYDPLDPKDVLDACSRALRTVEESAKSFELEMRHQQHTIFNVLPTNQIDVALRLTGDTGGFLDDAKRKMNVLETSLSIPFRDLPLKHLKGVDTVFKLLNWLKTDAFSSRIEPTLVLPSDGPDIRLRGRTELANAFTLFWNLWDNAAKNHPREHSERYSIVAEWHHELLFITFKNAGDLLPQKFVHYLAEDNAPWPESSNRKGLIVIKDKLRALNWQVREVAAEGEFTRITIAIPGSADGAA